MQALGNADSNGSLSWSGGERTYEMFKEHDWLEPGESIFAENVAILLPLGCMAVRIDARQVAPVGWPEKVNNVWRCSAVIGPDSSEEQKG